MTFLFLTLLDAEGGGLGEGLVGGRGGQKGKGGVWERWDLVSAYRYWRPGDQWSTQSLRLSLRQFTTPRPILMVLLQGEEAQREALLAQEEIRRCHQTAEAERAAAVQAADSTLVAKAMVPHRAARAL